TWRHRVVPSFPTRRSSDLDLQLPGQSLESVELLANPFAAEYGRFSTSVVQIQTRRGTNEWEFTPGNLIPRIRGFFKGVRSFEPRSEEHTSELQSRENLVCR